MKVFNEIIPLHKIGQFHEVLKSCNGRYLENPRKEGDCFRVSYHYEDMNGAREHQKQWKNLTTEIIEKRRESFFGKILKFFRK